MTPLCPMCYAYMVGVPAEGPWLEQWSCRACGTVVLPHIGGSLAFAVEQLGGAGRAAVPRNPVVRNSDEGKESS